MEQDNLIVKHRKERIWPFFVSFAVLLCAITPLCLIFLDWKSNISGALLLSSTAFAGIIIISFFSTLQNHRYTFRDDNITEEISKHNIFSPTRRKTIKINFDEIESIIQGTRNIRLFDGLYRYIRIQYKNSGCINVYETDGFVWAGKVLNYDEFIEHISQYWASHGLSTEDDRIEEEEGFFEEGTELFIDENGHFVDANGNQFDENAHDIDSNVNQLNEDNHLEASIEDEADYDIPEENTFGVGQILWTFFCLFISLFWGYRLITILSQYITTGKLDGQAGIGVFVFILFSGETYRQFFGKQ